MADIKISALTPGSQAAGGDIEIVQSAASFKVTIDTMAYQAANAVAITGGTITGISNLTIANAGTLTPASNDGAVLGSAALSWADLFIASGGVVNFNNGDVTITHAANTLTFAGATTTGYQFQDGPIRPVADDGVALGVSGTAFADLFLATGGVINWNAGDVTITHSANTLAFAGASTAYTFANGPVRPATNDGAALGVSGTAWSDLFLAAGGVINWAAGDVTISNPVADALAFAGATSGYSFTGGPIFPSTDDGLALGQAGTAFSDLFLATGGVISWDSGDVTITHSANTLAFAGAATAYTFANGPVRPATNDGAALGVSGTAWSDLFLATGGVIDWNAGDVTITHSANTLAFTGASSGYTFDALVSSTAALLANSGTAIPAGGTAGAGLRVSSTANFGVFFGSGVPTLVAAQGSLYMRSDGSSTSTRLYVATNGSGGWTNVTTAI